MLALLLTIAPTLPQEPLHEIRPGAKSGERWTYNVRLEYETDREKAKWKGAAEPPEDLEFQSEAGGKTRFIGAFTDRVTRAVDGRRTELARKWTKCKHNTLESKTMKNIERPKGELHYEFEEDLFRPVDDSGRWLRRSHILHWVLADFSFAELAPSAYMAVGETWGADGVPLLALLNGTKLRDSYGAAKQYRVWVEEGRFSDDVELDVTLSEVEETEDGVFVWLDLRMDVHLAVPWEPGELAFGGGTPGHILTSSTRHDRSFEVRGRALWSLERGALVELEATNVIELDHYTCTHERPGDEDDPEPPGALEDDSFTLLRIAQTVSLNLGGKAR